MEKQIEKGKIGGWRPNSGRKPGFVGYWRGKKRPNAFNGKRAKIKYGDANIFSKLDFHGEKHPNWKGGQWLYWRKHVLKRDNWTCRVCNLQDKQVMQVDHILAKSIIKHSGKEIKDELNNLQTLCANCHMRKTLRDRKESARLRKIKNG